MDNHQEKFEDELKRCDELLNTGERFEAGLIADQILITMKKRPRSFPRLLRPRFAYYLRRLGRSHVAVRILHPLVKLKLGKLHRLNDLSQQEIDELEEYSALLINLRAEEQASLILEAISRLESPLSFKTKLFQGMLAINKWDYKLALEHLQVFVDMKKPARLTYYHFVGVVNLMAAKVSLIDDGKEFAQGNKLRLFAEFEHYLALTREMNYLVLHANLLEIKTQALVKLSAVGSSSKDMRAARKILRDDLTRDSLYVRKWSLLAKMPSQDDNREKVENFLEGLEKLKMSAQEISDYETVRDLDFYQAHFRPELIDRIFYGTPSISFRQKTLSLSESSISDHYWHEVEPFKKGKRIKEFDYLQYPSLKAGTLIYKVLFGLCLDFYRPLNIYALFELLFPQEFYNPETSANKIHKALQRTRQWLKGHNLPLEIFENDGNYSLLGPVAIKIYYRERFPSAPTKELPLLAAINFDLMKTRLGRNEFKIQEAQVILNHPNLRATQRFLKILIEEGLVEVLGNTRATSYRIL